jgi:hypothetical protein
VISRISSPLLIFVCLFAGCWTTKQVVDYCLTEPTAALVRERVKVGDHVDLVLEDNSNRSLTVSGITDTTIGGKDGTNVPIDSVREITCTSTRYQASSTTGALAAGAAEGAAPLIGVLALPVVLGMKVQELAQAPIREWPDSELCRLSNQSDRYTFDWTSVADSEDDLPGPEIVGEEVKRRQLNCSPTLLAERFCAQRYSHGPTFSTCVGIVEPLERYGMDGLKVWDDQLLCDALETTVLEYRILIDALEFQKIFNAEVDRRGIDCGI